MLDAQAQRADPDSALLLRTLITDPEASVRARATFTLGLDHPDAFEVLAALAGTDPSPLVRAAAATAAVRAGQANHAEEAGRWSQQLSKIRSPRYAHLLQARLGSLVIWEKMQRCWMML